MVDIWQSPGDNMNFTQFNRWYNKKTNDIHLRGAILEDYIGRNLKVSCIAIDRSVSEDFIYKTIAFYKQKPPFNLTIISSI
jgi:hypothetical protein